MIKPAMFNFDFDYLKKEKNRSYEYRLLKFSDHHAYRLQKQYEFFIFKWWVDCSGILSDLEMNKFLNNKFINPDKNKNWEVFI